MPNNCQHPELCLLSETCVPCTVCPNAKEKADDRLAPTPCSDSEPHRIMPAMGKVILKPCGAAHRAEKALAILRDGGDFETDCLETLDEIVMALTTLEEHCLEVHSTKGAMPVEMVKRLRFERGFDIRPNADALATAGEKSPTPPQND